MAEGVTKISTKYSHWFKHYMPDFPNVPSGYPLIGSSQAIKSMIKMKVKQVIMYSTAFQTSH